MSDNLQQDLKKTPLDALHRALGAKMVPFAGYSMPVHYSGILAEHTHTREQASLFDVSHMGQVTLRGPSVEAALESLVPADIEALSVGKICYTLLTNDVGGIIDDLMVTARGDHLYLVVNASRKEADIAHIRRALPSDIQIDVLDRALLALQGPTAAAVLAHFAPPCRHLLFMTAGSLTIGDIPCLVSRAGYTGEDGFEISVEADKAEALCRLLLGEAGVRPAGLGARDTLRLEAGLCLYGNDIGETTTPVEAGLSWTINKRRRAEGGYPGAALIGRQIAEGPIVRRVGIALEGKVPARTGCEIADAEGHVIGSVTSGGFGPTIGHPIAMAYVPSTASEPGTPINLMVRGKPHPGRISKLPFVEHHYYKR